MRGVYYLCTIKTKINTPLMYEVLDKDTIKSEILPFLSVAKRGYVTKSDLVEVIQCILYKLKTGCQWHMLPVSAIFTGRVLSYKSVYAHFRKWSRNGEWKKVWGMILSRHRSFLDMSSVDLDGSHTTTLRGGECCGYQGRKKRTTTNAIYVTDRQGIPLAMSTPVSGSHNDLHNISLVLQDLFAGIKDSGLSVSGLFLNADAGFDYSGEVAISRRCSQTSPSISGEGCGEMTSYLMSCFTRRDTALKGPMCGWTHTGACSTGSIPHKPVGRDGTISHFTDFSKKDKKEGKV